MNGFVKLGELFAPVFILAGVVVAILLVLLVPVIGNGLIREINQSFWLKKNYPNYKDWPEKAREFVYVPMPVDYFASPLSTILLLPLAVGIVVRLIGVSTGLNALDAIGGVILGVPFLVYVTLVFGAIWEVQLGEGRPPDIREAKRKKALRWLSSKHKDQHDDMQDHFQLWHAFYSHEELTQRFSDDGEIRKEYYQFMNGIVLPKELANEIHGTIKELIEIYDNVLEKDVLSEQLSRYVSRRITKLEELPSKFSVEGNDNNDGQDRAGSQPPVRNGGHSQFLTFVERLVRLFRRTVGDRIVFKVKKQGQLESGLRLHLPRYLNHQVQQGVERLCKKCEGQLANRSDQEAMTEGKSPRQYSCKSWCIKCSKLPCMVEGCSNRAAVVIRHAMAVGSGVSATGVRNDLWICNDHRTTVTAAQLREGLFALARLSEIVLVCFTVAMVFAGVSRYVIILIVIAAAAIFWFLHIARKEIDRMSGSDGPVSVSKKRKYITTVRGDAGSLWEDDSWDGEFLN